MRPYQRRYDSFARCQRKKRFRYAWQAWLRMRWVHMTTEDWHADIPSHVYPCRWGTEYRLGETAVLHYHWGHTGPGTRQRSVRTPGPWWPGAPGPETRAGRESRQQALRRARGRWEKHPSPALASEIERLRAELGLARDK